MSDQSYSSSTGSIYETGTALFTALTEVDLAGTDATVVAHRITGSRRYTLTRLAVVVETATVSSGDIVLTAKRRKLVDSDTGAATIGTATLPTGVTAGSVYIRDFASDIQPGELITITLTTAAAGGSKAGKAVVLIEGYESDVPLPEIAAGATASAGADKADSGTGQLVRINA